MTPALLGLPLTLGWLYLLGVLRRAKLHFWRFLAGSCGLFLLMMVYLRPIATQPLAQTEASLAGIFGSMSGTYTAYFKYGVVFVESAKGAITLQINFECSGIIELMVFVALLAFFEVYSPGERLAVGILGCAYIMLANVLRIIVVCEILHFGGPNYYYLAHSLAGRLVFYGLSVLLYFYVFTKPHILRMKIGTFRYGDS